MKLRVSMLIAATLMTSCTSSRVPSSAETEFALHVQKTAWVRLTGWARLRGEVMLYASKEAMRAGSKYPECVSGVFTQQAEKDLSEFEGKHVVVTGQLMNYAGLDEDEAPLLQRKVLAGSVIPNFCFGTNVLLLEGMEEVEH